MWSSTATSGSAELGRRSDPRWRDEAAAYVLLGVVEDLLPEGPVLLHDDGSEQAAEGLRGLDMPFVRWRRFDGGGETGTVAPSRGAGLDSAQPSSAVCRLPRSWPAFEYALRMCVAALPAGAPVLVHGAKDEGIQSAPRRMEGFLTEVETVANARRCRVIRGVVPEATGAGSEAPPPQLADFRQTQQVDLGWGPLEWVSYPGTFARGGLDGGTQLLLANLPDVGEGARVLDFAAGTGILARGVVERSPGAVVRLVEPDALARAAALENMGPAGNAGAGGDLFVGFDEWPAAGPWDAIVSNPPYHQGKEESLEVIDELIVRAAGALSPGGELRIVVQRRLPVEELLLDAFSNVRAVADEGPYRVWSAAGA